MSVIAMKGANALTKSLFNAVFRLHNVGTAERGFHMQPFGLWHWIILGTIVVLNAIPITKNLGRVGLTKWWTIAFLIPS